MPFAGKQLQNLYFSYTTAEAVRKEYGIYGGKPRHKYFFNCRVEGCQKEFYILESQFKAPRTGKCRNCSQQATPYQYLFTKMKHRAAQAAIKVEFSFAEFLIAISDNECHYCGKIINRAPNCIGKWSGDGYALDRKDSTKPYSLENCVSCCPLCNWTKGNRFSYKEFLLLSPILTQIRENRELVLSPEAAYEVLSGLAGADWR